MKGYTLIEVMVTFLFIAILIAILLGALDGCESHFIEDVLR